MIDPQTLDKVLPLPELGELLEQKSDELKAKGFAVTNLSPGGVFYTLLAICCQMRIELGLLCRAVLSGLFLTHAGGAWLDLRLADFGKMRKQAQKAQGIIALTRGESEEAVRISKGHVFRTLRDVTGEELRFFALEDAVLKQGEQSVNVPIEAELEGSRYNVAAGQIARSLTHIEGGCTVANPEGWISREGADAEDDAAARERGLGAWSELAARPTAEKYRNVAEGVPGVLFATVDDQHPRGQGTVDIVVTGTAGEATEGLLTAVREAAEQVRGSYDNLLVRSSVTVEQPVSVTLTVYDELASEGLAEGAAAVIADLLRVHRDRELNELIHADVIHAIKSKYPQTRNIKVTVPSADVILERDKVIIAGGIDVLIERV